MKNRAFTLIEMLTVIALTALIFSALGMILRYFYITNAYALQQAQAVASARRALESSMVALREASYGADGSYPIASAATSSIVFYADVNGTADQISYYLLNGVLYKTLRAPGGSPLTYVGQPAATTTIATYVVNATSTPVFTYYNASGTALTSPVNIGDITSVGTSIVVDVNTNRSPVSFTLSAAATLRNLRNQL